MNRIYLSPPHISGSERSLLIDAFESNWLAPLGPHVDAFEREFASNVTVAHAAALSSGTAAIHLMLLLSNVKPGDEVVTSTLTFAATANAISYVGAVPVFIDSEPNSWNMDPDLLEEELIACSVRGRLPAAVLVVDLYGQCADYQRIEKICERFAVPILEDAAEALGAARAGKFAGKFGRMAAFSFNGNKIITTSGGGMIVSDDQRLIEQARFLASQARDPAPHYEHSQIGYNYRLSNLLAALGRGQLQSLESRILRRRRNFELYKSRLGSLPGVNFMPEPDDCRSTRWLTCMLVDPTISPVDREHVRMHLEQYNIESRPVWKPMHLQPVFSCYRKQAGMVAERLFSQGLCLPSGSNLSDDDVHFVADHVSAAWR